MPVNVRSDYPGESRTRISGQPALPTLPEMGGRGPEDYLRGMMRDEKKALERKDRQRRSSRSRVPVAAASRAMGPSAGAGFGANNQGIPKHLKRAQNEAAYQQALASTHAARAAYSRAPMKMTNIANAWNGMVMDPNAMSGVQRQMFLPSQSGFAAPASAGLGPSVAALPETRAGGGGGAHATNARRHREARAGSTAGQRRAGGRSSASPGAAYDEEYEVDRGAGQTKQAQAAWRR